MIIKPEQLRADYYLQRYDLALGDVVVLIDGRGAVVTKCWENAAKFSVTLKA